MSTRISTLEQSIAAGLDFILALQSSNGSWTDWALPPGSSSVWTNAYVGYKLRCLPRHLKAKAAPHIAAASHWLLDNQFAEGGWGYNETVGPDADSTSYAILFLSSAGCHVPEAAYPHLARYQCLEGGFSTYLSDGESNSWTVSHPDVTPIALLALLTQTVPDRRSIQRGIDYVLEQQTPEGLWNSFWWDSLLYGTEVSLSFLRAANVDVEIAAPVNLSRTPPSNAFETALMISILLYMDTFGLHTAIHDLTDKLIIQQESDGSWKTAPILRITRRDCFEPWTSGDSGPLFPDIHKLFTTSTVLHALSRMFISLLKLKSGTEKNGAG
jgi:hypothetical protein